MKFSSNNMLRFLETKTSQRNLLGVAILITRISLTYLNCTFHTLMHKSCPYSLFGLCSQWDLTCHSIAPSKLREIQFANNTTSTVLIQHPEQYNYFECNNETISILLAKIYSPIMSELFFSKEGCTLPDTL